jgi:hypothetical protein
MSIAKTVTWRVEIWLHGSIPFKFKLVSGTSRSEPLLLLNVDSRVHERLEQESARRKVSSEKKKCRGTSEPIKI